MTREKFKEIINTGLEMQFRYNNKWYSFMYDGKNSNYEWTFGEFDKESTVVNTF